MTPSWTQVGPFKPIFRPSFSDHLSNSISDFILDRFRTPNQPQNQSKINQQILPKSTYKQVLFQLPLRSNFEDNLLFKQNGRCSKIVPKPYVFVCFLDIRSCQQKQTRDMQRIQKSSKTTSKINELFVEIKWIFNHVCHRFPSPKFGRLGGGLGLDCGSDFRPIWGQKRRPNGIKKSSRKKMPTWAPTWPQEASQNGRMNRRRGRRRGPRSPLDRFYA